MFPFLSFLRQSLPPWGQTGYAIHNKRLALLRLLSIAHSQQLDAQTLIENLAAEHPDRYGRKLSQLARWIAAGSSLDTALEHTPGALCEEDTLALQCAIETDSLDQIYPLLISLHEHEEPSRANEILRGALGHVIAITSLTMLIIAFLTVYIVPVFEEVFDEFGIASPFAMKALIDFSQSLSTVMPMVLLTLVGTGCLLIFADVRRAFHRSPLSRLIPARHDRQSAGLMRLLALPTAAGSPISPTLTAAAEHHLDHGYRQRLLRARIDARNESDVWQQLAAQGLISKTQGEQLALITTPTLRAWTLMTLADRQCGRADRKTEYLANVLQHVPVILIGVLVGWIAFAVIQTLSGLIRFFA